MSCLWGRRFDTAQVWIGIELLFKALCADFTIFIQNVRIDTGNHFGAGVSCVTLCGFQIAVGIFQLISSAGMAERVKNDVGQIGLLFELSKLLFDYSVVAGTTIGLRKHQVVILVGMIRNLELFLSPYV